MDSPQLRPDIIGELILVDNIQPKLVDDIQVDHVRVQVRPELNVVRSTLLDRFLQLLEQILKDNDDREVKISILSPFLEAK